jgi:hypothetical protein
MNLSPKQIILIAVSKYLSKEIYVILKDEISIHKQLSPQKFVELIERYFDFTVMRDNPLIPEDIWIFNYLMYENKSKNNVIFQSKEKINIAGKFRKSELLKKYEIKVLIPRSDELNSENLI